MTVEALFWTQEGKQTRTLSAAAEVKALVDTLLDGYTASGTLPGIELRRDASGAGLSVAAAPFGWALIHTDEDFNQHCTRGDAPTSEPALGVQWEEETPIPRAWFVPQEQAIAGIDRWAKDGGLAEEIDWSGDCA